jgi:type II secretory pathway pseudopilin PulG
MRLGKGERGFTYVAVIAMVALMGIGLAALGPVWAEETRREREDELLRIGSLYADAIGAYYEASPGSAKRYPPTLEALTEDTRFVGTMRHLRVAYLDPMTGQPFALLRRGDGGIVGVHSTSRERPLRTVAVSLGAVTLVAAERYADWHFIARID